MKSKKYSSDDEELNAEITEAGIAFTDALSSVFLGFSPIGPLNNLRKVYHKYNEEIFIGKLSAFLKEARGTSKKQREKFKESMADDFNNFTKKLWTAIDKIDSEYKSKVLGKLYNALMTEKISSEVFLKSATALINLDSSSVSSFLNSHDLAVPKVVRRGDDGHLFNEFLAAGLVTREIEFIDDSIRKASTGNSKMIIQEKYTMTYFGSYFREFGK